MPPTKEVRSRYREAAEKAIERRRELRVNESRSHHVRPRTVKEEALPCMGKEVLHPVVKGEALPRKVKEEVLPLPKTENLLLPGKSGIRTREERLPLHLARHQELTVDTGTGKQAYTGAERKPAAVAGKFQAVATQGLPRGSQVERRKVLTGSSKAERPIGLAGNCQTEGVNGIRGSSLAEGRKRVTHQQYHASRDREMLSRQLRREDAVEDDPVGVLANPSRLKENLPAQKGSVLVGRNKKSTVKTSRTRQNQVKQEIVLMDVAAEGHEKDHIRAFRESTLSQANEFPSRSQAQQKHEKPCEAAKGKRLEKEIREARLVQLIYESETLEARVNSEELAVTSSLREYLRILREVKEEERAAALELERAKQDVLASLMAEVLHGRIDELLRRSVDGNLRNYLKHIIAVSEGLQLSGVRTGHQEDAACFISGLSDTGRCQVDLMASSLREIHEAADMLEHTESRVKIMQESADAIEKGSVELSDQVEELVDLTMRYASLLAHYHQEGPNEGARSLANLELTLKQINVPAFAGQPSAT